MSTKMKIEAIKLTSDDVSNQPKRYMDYPKPVILGRYYFWLIHRDDPNKPPISGLRIMNRDGFTSKLGLVRMGETPLARQTVLEISHKTKGKASAEYRLSDSEPGVYEASAQEPYVLAQYSGDWSRLVESDLIDLKYEHTPYALSVYPGCPYPDTAYICQHGIWHGKIEGKEVRFLGTWDRCVGDYAPMQLETPMIYNSFYGFREDGRQEYGCITLVNGTSFAFYCLEGEEPIAVEGVEADLKWELVPYMEDGDTYTVTEATYRFAGKTLHYKARWGFNGNTTEQVDVKGFAQSSGDWYVGDTEYKHTLDFYWAENWKATKENLTQHGYMK